jgi:predicted GNAT family acetyltransferase
LILVAVNESARQQRAVDDARRDGFKIIPLCPYAKAQFQRHAEWRDVTAG